MTSPHYRGEGGENTRHRVTGGVSVPVATGRGEGRRFFSRHTDSTGLSNSCGLCGLVHKGNRGMLGIRKRTTEKPRAPAVTPGTPGTAKNTISGRAVDATFQNHRNSGITRRTGGIRRRTPQCRRTTPRGMRRDRNGIRGTREPEENECGRQKKSLEFENRMNSKCSNPEKTLL